MKLQTITGMQLISISGVGSWEFEVWSLEFEVWRQEFGVWSQEFGVRSLELGDWIKE